MSISYTISSIWLIGYFEDSFILLLFHQIGRNPRLELTSPHNLTFYLWLMEQIREQIQNDTFHEWYPGIMKLVEQRI